MDLGDLRKLLWCEEILQDAPIAQIRGEFINLELGGSVYISHSEI